MIGLIGSSGFIGRTVLDRLAQTDLRLRAFARSAPETGGSVNGVPLSRYSLTDAYDPKVFAGFDTLVLCASATRPNTSANSPVHEWLANVAPHLTLFEALLDSDVQHIVYLSSGGAVYGNRTSSQPIDEESPRIPADPYGYGKLSIESGLPLIWKGLSHNGPRRFTIVRPSNPIGRYQLASVGTHGLVTTVLDRLRNGLPIVVQGDGLAVRDYFAANDLADLVRVVVQSSTINNSIAVNAGSGVGMNILQVIEACAAYLNVSPDVQMNSGVKPAVQCNVLDPSRARALFGWTPRVSFPESLAELVAALDARDAGIGGAA